MAEPPVQVPNAADGAKGAGGKTYHLADLHQLCLSGLAEGKSRRHCKRNKANSFHRCFLKFAGRHSLKRNPNDRLPAVLFYDTDTDLLWG